MNTLSRYVYVQNDMHMQQLQNHTGLMVLP